LLRASSSLVYLAALAAAAAVRLALAFVSNLSYRVVSEDLRPV